METIQNHTFEHDEFCACEGKILVVDDDKAIRDVIMNMLLYMGCETIDAEDALEGLRIFQSHDCKIIVTDMDMPGMDGLHFAAHIKEIAPSTPVVLMSGQAREQLMEKVKGSSIDMILIKPFRFEELRETIQLLQIHPGMGTDNFNGLLENRNQVERTEIRLVS